MKVPGILKNKYVCYALMALAALNVIGYLTVKAWECLALFALTAYSVHSYCGDKSLAILAALFVANFIFGCGRVKEGFEDALKGTAEHMQDAANSALIAEGLCTGHDLATEAGRTACESATNEAGVACNLVKAKLQGCVDENGAVVAKENNVAWTQATCVAPNKWNEAASAATCS